MDTLDLYKIDVLNLRADSETFRYAVGDDFFQAVQSNVIKGGRLDVELAVKKTAGAFRFTFRIAGTVTVACDRCLEDMQLPVETEREMTVKLGEDYFDDGDIVTIPYEDGVADVAWNLYEFIALEVPLKHVHEEGACDETMLGVLNEHRAGEPDNGGAENDTANEEPRDRERPTDPRWNELKKILDNN